MLAESLHDEFMSSSSILHLLPVIFLIFTCVDPDPYSEFGSGSAKVLNSEYESNLDPNPQHCLLQYCSSAPRWRRPARSTASSSARSMCELAGGRRRGGWRRSWSSGSSRRRSSRRRNRRFSVRCARGATERLSSSSATVVI